MMIKVSSLESVVEATLGMIVRRSSSRGWDDVVGAVGEDSVMILHVHMLCLQMIQAASRSGRTV